MSERRASASNDDRGGKAPPLLRSLSFLAHPGSALAGDAGAPSEAAAKESEEKRSSLTDTMQLRKTKIVCTIGPASWTVERLCELLHAGMNVARINFSHGDHETHARTIARVREASEKTGIICGVLLDTKGPEIRTGLLKGGADVELAKGQELTIRCDAPAGFEGDARCISVDYANLPKVTAPGRVIKIDDGLIICRVERVDDTSVTVRVTNRGMLGQRKGVNLPGQAVDLPAVTERDVADIRFGVEQGVDFIAASFTRDAASVRAVRELIADSPRIMIISKIENEQGMTNFDDILAESDGIMVARGDLGVEIPIQQVVMAQKGMIFKCNAAGKPVITATQMLESMVGNPRPTRAEASDVANAVFDGTDCVMLSGETAKGKYPVEACSVMARIAKTAEFAVDYRQFYLSQVNHASGRLNKAESITSAAVKTVMDLEAPLAVVLTQSGSTARYVSKYHPPVRVLTVTSSAQTARQALVSRALHPLVVPDAISNEQSIRIAAEHAAKEGWIRGGETIVIVSGVKRGVSGGTNTLQVFDVPKPQQ